RYTRQPTLLRYALTLICFACGLLSKATLVTVPLVLLLLDYWPLQRATDMRAWRRMIVEKIPLFALSAASGLATVFAQGPTISSLAQLPLLWRIKNALVSTIIYIIQVFWPAKLALFYPHPHDQLNGWLVLASAVLIAAMTALAIMGRRKYPYLLVGWGWYLA